MGLSHYSVQGTLQVVGELKELWDGVEVLLVNVEEAVHDANDSIVGASQLTQVLYIYTTLNSAILVVLPQNGSRMVEESTHILDEYLAYRDRLRLLDIGASIAILHALALSQQVQTIME